MVILLSPANSQSEFAPNSQYCEFQAVFAANSCCERIRSEFGEFKLNSLRICIPNLRTSLPIDKYVSISIRRNGHDAVSSSSIKESAFREVVLVTYQGFEPRIFICLGFV